MNSSRCPLIECAAAGKKKKKVKKRKRKRKSWIQTQPKRLAWLLFYDMDGRGFKKADITGLPEWVYSGGPRIIRTIAVYG